MLKALREIDARLTAEYVDPCSEQEATEDAESGMYGSESVNIRSGGEWHAIRALLARERGA
jgi:hypothetical protein